jgi:DNA polymerase III alpha subunit
VIRPGADDESKKLAFTRCYQGLELITYSHPGPEPALRDALGLVVDEHHILQICETFVGLPPGRAAVLRRALNKYTQSTIVEIPLF